MEEQNNQVMKDNTQPMSLKDWIITFLILLIPFVNIVMPFVWAFGGNVNISKKNYFRAYLIFLAISLVIFILFFSAMMAFILSIIGSQGAQFKQY